MICSKAFDVSNRLQEGSWASSRSVAQVESSSLNQRKPILSRSKGQGIGSLDYLVGGQATSLPVRLATAACRCQGLVQTLWLPSAVPLKEYAMIIKHGKLYCRHPTHNTHLETPTKPSDRPSRWLPMRWAVMMGHVKPLKLQ